jgi:hypothetical protein
MAAVDGPPPPADTSTNVAGGGLSGKSVELYVDNSNGNFTSNELSRINDAVAAINSTISGYGVSMTEVSDPSQSNFTLQMAATCELGGFADGVLGCIGAKITIITGWNWYDGADPTQIGSNQYDFQTVLTHELGHSLGLGESPDSTSVMYGALETAVVKRSLTAADLMIPQRESGADGEHAAPVLGGSERNVSVAPGQTTISVLVTATSAGATTNRAAVEVPRYDSHFATSVETGLKANVTGFGLTLAANVDSGMGSPAGVDILPGVDDPDQWYWQELIRPEERELLPGPEEQLASRLAGLLAQESGHSRLAVVSEVRTTEALDYLAANALVWEPSASQQPASAWFSRDAAGEFAAADDANGAAGLAAVLLGAYGLAQSQEKRVSPLLKRIRDQLLSRQT